jgi:hypothetical protein
MENITDLFNVFLHPLGNPRPGEMKTARTARDASKGKHQSVPANFNSAIVDQAFALVAIIKALVAVAQSVLAKKIIKRLHFHVSINWLYQKHRPLWHLKLRSNPR